LLDLFFEGGGMEKKTLVKTDKVIKVGLDDGANVRRYMKYHMEWELDSYLNKLYEVKPKAKDDTIGVTIPLNFVLLPSTIYRLVPLGLSSVIEYLKSDIVSLDNFSYFNVYQVVPDPKGKIDSVNLSLIIEGDESKNKVKIHSLWLEIENRSNINYPEGLIFSSVFLPKSNDPDDFEKSLKRILFSISKGGPSVSLDYMNLGDAVEVEDGLTTSLNLFHILYTHNFEGNDMTSWLFKRYSDTAKGLGCEFEKALSKLTGVLRLVY
jgi:hypothetical protein